MLEKYRMSRLMTAFLIVATGLAATTVSADIDQSRLDAVAADIQERVDNNRLSGAVILITQDGEVQMNEAFGYQNVEDQVPMATDTIFRIFSMTKPVTGTALMLLYDEGKFELDDPVENYIPEFKGMEVLVSQNDDGSFETEPVDHPMTIRELVSHTGGLLYTPPLSRGPIADAYSAVGINDLPNYTLAESIPKLQDIPLGHQPGTQWVYSISVDVQGYLVEVLSGMPFDEFLQQRLFEPLGMNETGFFVPEDQAHRMARTYYPINGSLRRTDNGEALTPPKFISGGGGLSSTASDYMKFAMMHLNNGVHEGQRILSEQAIQLMRSNQLPESITGIGFTYPGNVFGIDFAVVNNSALANGAPEGTHWWWGIAGTWFWIDPVEDIVFIGLIQNNDLGQSLEIQREMRSAIYQ